MDAKTNRTINIRALVAEAGGPADFAAMTRRWPASQASQWISATNPKPIGHKLAREIEDALGKPYAWLDQDHVNYSVTDTENNSRIGTVSQSMTFDPAIVAVAWNWVRFEEGPIDHKGRQPYAYPTDLDRAKRLIELCAMIQADGGTLTPEHSEALITAARARQKTGGGKHGPGTTPGGSPSKR